MNQQTYGNLELDANTIASVPDFAELYAASARDESGEANGIAVLESHVAETQSAKSATSAEARRAAFIAALIVDLGKDVSWAPRSAADITHAETGPTEWDIADILPRYDGPANLFALPGSYKTYLALHILRCMVTGDKVGGLFSVRKRDLGLYLNFDAGARSFTKRFDLVMDKVPNAHFSSPSNFKMKTLKKIFAHYRGAFVVIDCMADCFDGDKQGDPAKLMRKFVRKLRKLYEEFECNGIIIDHARRSKKGEGIQYYGSVQKKGTFRTMIGLSAKSSTSVTVACEKMSEGPEFKDFVMKLKLDAPTSFIAEMSSYAPLAPSDAEHLRTYLEGVSAASRAEIEAALDWKRGRFYKAVEGLGASINSPSGSKARYYLTEPSESYPKLDDEVA